MAFPKRLLNDNEEVVLDLHPHWWFFGGPGAAVIAASALVIAVDVIFHGTVEDVLLLITLAVLLFALLWFGARYARWATTDFVVTTDRLIYRTGVFAKHGREIPLERVNDISFHQSVFERVLRAGDLVIESAGELGQQPFSNIRSPALVQNEIYRQIERANERNADRIAGHRELSIPEQLERLDELRQRGILTDAEFQAKKTQLLDRM